MRPLRTLFSSFFQLFRGLLKFELLRNLNQISN